MSDTDTDTDAPAPSADAETPATDAPTDKPIDDSAPPIDDAPPVAAGEAAPRAKKPRKSRRPQWIVFAIVGLLSLLADQGTKIWARGSLPTVFVNGHGIPSPEGCAIPDDIVNRTCAGKSVPVIDGVWEWRLSMNPGSAFGFLSGQDIARVLLSVVGIAAVGGMLWMLRKARPDQRVLHWALALVAGGAVGNLIDRIHYGVVTDFVLWRYHEHEWPVFNVADVVLVIGVGLMFIDIQKEGKREKRKRAKRQAKAKKAGLVADLKPAGE